MVKLDRITVVIVLLIGVIIPINAQNLKITGNVTDTDGIPVIGATITIKEISGVGTITDMDGKFFIEAEANQTLVFSYIGMKSQEVKITENTNLNIMMKSESVGLDEVVVVGYGTQSRRTITSAITKVGSEALKNVPVNTVGEGLKGKIAGARIYSNNNTPGADATIRIRGGSSINN